MQSELSQGSWLTVPILGKQTYDVLRSCAANVHTSMITQYTQTCILNTYYKFTYSVLKVPLRDHRDSSVASRSRLLPSQRSLLPRRPCHHPRLQSFQSPLSKRWRPSQLKSLCPRSQSPSSLLLPLLQRRSKHPSLWRLSLLLLHPAVSWPTLRTSCR
jgi:hypothetical protein